jgi:hypothetical protein
VVATPFAVVAVSSLDGRPISESGRLLVSTSADALALAAANRCMHYEVVGEP